MECLGDELVFVFLRGTLPEPQRDGVREHIGHCSACRRLVSEVARSLDDGTHQTTPSFGTRTPQLEQSSPPPLAPGQLVGRYILGAQLGTGTSGVVHRAHDPHLGRDVALKIIHDSEVTLSAVPSRLMREAKAMARLNDPNVVTVYDAGTWHGSVFIAMELVEGRTLRDWLREAPRSPGAIVASLVAAGRGLAAAHGVGLVHRDFKPANVLVGKDGRVRVTDFGLAQPAFADEAPTVASTADGADPPWAAITQTGSLGGTPGYMAPEVFAGSVADARSDQYSFCVALFESLHGRKPIERDNIPEHVGATLVGDIEWPPSASMTPPVERALRRGLQRDPAARYPNMGSLLAELDMGASVPAMAAPVVAAPGPRWTVLAAAAAVAFGAVLFAGWPRPKLREPAQAALVMWFGRVDVPAPPADMQPQDLPDAEVETAQDASDAASPLAGGPARKAGPRGGAPAAARPKPSATAAPADPDALLPDPWDGKKPR